MKIYSPVCRECEWTITAPQGQQVELNITSFDLENHTRCNYDYLEIRCVPWNDVEGPLSMSP